MDIHCLNLKLTGKFVDKTPRFEYCIARKIFLSGEKKKEKTAGDVPLININKMCSVIGSFKVGKSQIVEDLLKDFGLKPSLHPPSEVINTTGEIIYHIKENDILLVDSEGLNQIVLTKHSHFIKKLVITHTILYSKLLFYVLDKFTQEEHSQIMSLISLIKSNNPLCRLIILHNLKSISSDNSLNGYVEQYLSAHDELFSFGNTPSLSMGNGYLSMSTTVGNITFEEFFCADKTNSSYKGMIKKLHNIILGEQPLAVLNFDQTIERTLNILNSNEESKIKFNGSSIIDLDDMKFDIQNLHIASDRRKGETETYKFAEYEISIPFAELSAEKIKINFKQQVIHLSVIINYGISDPKPYTFEIIELLLAESKENLMFTQASITTTNHCSFKFKVKIRDVHDNQ